MIDIKELEEMGKKAGFSHVALLKRDTIELMPEVREMCKKNTCRKMPSLNKALKKHLSCEFLRKRQFRTINKTAVIQRFYCTVQSQRLSS